MTTKQAVLATLSYFDLFEVPLTREEISEFLFFLEPDEEKIDIYLRESPLIREKDGYYSIEGSDEFYERFFEGRTQARKLWKKVRRFHFLFSLCPFVKLVAVCNSLPLYAVDENSDIDLFVVTKKNRMFLTRLFLTLLTSLFGVRRHGKKVARRFCLSFYITEDALDLRSIALEPYDIYLAYWIKTLEPVAGDYETYQNFLRTNAPWMSDYFKGIAERKRYYRKPKPWQQKWKEKLESWLGKNEWEEKTKRSQMRRARMKYFLLKDRSGTILSDTMLKFHNEDERAEIRRQWVSRLNAIL